MLFGALALEAVAVALVLPASPAFCVAINMEDPGGAVYLMWALGIGGALGVALMLRKALALRDIYRTPIMIKLLHDADDVVWVHDGTATENRVYGQTVSRSRHVAFLTESGDNDSIEMAEHAARRVVHAMEAYLPHATVGAFSPDMLARYKADRGSLRRGAASSAREGGSYRTAPATAKTVLPKPVSSPYWLSALVCVALVLAGPPIASAVLPGAKQPSGAPQRAP